MLLVPAATPVTTPPVFTVAIAVALLIHVPPDTVLVRVVVDPVHTVAVPPIAAGVAFTVTFAVVVAVLHTPVLE